MDRTERGPLYARINSMVAGTSARSRTNLDRFAEHEWHNASPGSRTLLPLRSVFSSMGGAGNPQSAHVKPSIFTA